MVVCLLWMLLLLVALPVQAGVSCDGVDDKVVLNNESLYDCANATCTLSFWLNTANAGSPRHFVSKAGPGTGWQAGFAGFIQLIIRDSGGNSAAVRLGATTMNDSVWHHHMLVFTTSTTVSATNDITIYTDGVLSQGGITRNGNFYAPNNNDVEFCHNTVNANFTAMVIDDVQMYSGDLGLAGAERLFKSRARFLPLQATPLFYFPMNTCTPGAAIATPFNTRTGNGTTATVTGAVCSHYNQLMHARGVE